MRGGATDFVTPLCLARRAAPRGRARVCVLAAGSVLAWYLFTPQPHTPPNQQQVRQVRRFRQSCRTVDCFRRADMVLEKVAALTDEADRIIAH